jgi:hypothetical protein
MIIYIKLNTNNNYKSLKHKEDLNNKYFIEMDKIYLINIF